MANDQPSGEARTPMGQQDTAQQPINQPQAGPSAARQPESRPGELKLPVVNENVVTPDEIVRQFLEAKEPITLSKFLEMNDVMPQEMLTAFETKSIALASKKRLTKYENNWVKDYIINSPRLRQADRASQEGGMSGVASNLNVLQIRIRPLPHRPDDPESSDGEYSEIDDFETPPEHPR